MVKKKVKTPKRQKKPKTLKTLKKKIPSKQKRVYRKTSKKKALTKPDVFKEFILWISPPEPLRKPKTQGQFGKKFKVSEQTLSAWKQRDDFWAEVEKEWKKWGKGKTSNVVFAFYNKLISDKITADFRLWFQYFLGWSEKQEYRHSGSLNLTVEYVEPKKSQHKG